MKISKEQKEAIEYLKTRLYGNEGCKYIDVAQEDLRIIINLVDRKEKDIEGWKKYCEEIEEEQIEMSNKNCELEFEVEKLQKENEELKEYLITQNCEINRLNLAKIRLELSQVPDTTEQYKYLKNEYKMRLERTDFENYKSNYISIQKVKDKIKEKDYTNEEVVNNCVEVLQELLESE